jgi:hypothetical protein
MSAVTWYGLFAFVQVVFVVMSPDTIVLAGACAESEIGEVPSSAARAGVRFPKSRTNPGINTSRKAIAMLTRTYLFTLRYSFP